MNGNDIIDFPGVFNCTIATVSIGPDSWLAGSGRSARCARCALRRVPPIACARWSRSMHGGIAAGHGPAASLDDHCNTCNPSDTFVFEALIGKGSYGRVYRTRARTDGAVVAFKVLPLEEESVPQDMLRELSRSAPGRAICKHHHAYHECPLAAGPRALLSNASLHMPKHAPMHASKHMPSHMSSHMSPHMPWHTPFIAHAFAPAIADAFAPAIAP